VGDAHGRHGRGENIYKGLISNPDRKGPHVGPRHGWGNSDQNGSLGDWLWGVVWIHLV
jgi:hypothetical protein